MNETKAIQASEQGAVVASDWGVMRDQAGVLVKSGFLPPAIKTPEQALALMMAGRELGIPPMQSIRGISIIQSVPCIKPELMLALCMQRVAGFKYGWGQCDNNSATVTVSRPSMLTPYESTFTMADAKAAGLAGKGPWQQYPGNMLRWRALGNALHVCCPDVLVGLYTPEELGADVNIDGEVVDVKPQQAPPRAQQPRSEPIPAEPVEDAQFTQAEEMATEKQLGLIRATRDKLWQNRRQAFFDFASDVLGRRITSTNEITKRECMDGFIDQLKAMTSEQIIELPVDGGQESLPDAGDAELLGLRNRIREYSDTPHWHGKTKDFTAFVGGSINRMGWKLGNLTVDEALLAIEALEAVDAQDAIDANTETEPDWDGGVDTQQERA